MARLVPVLLGSSGNFYGLRTDDDGIGMHPAASHVEILGRCRRLPGRSRNIRACTMVQTATVCKYIEQRTQTVNRQFV